MNIITFLYDFLTNIDSYVKVIIQNYGNFAYFILFAIIFLETGIVFTPFLPGDSMIFVVGALSGSGLLNVFILFFIFASAAILGDTVNYWIGSYFGEKILLKSRIFRRDYYFKTKDFYEAHGAKTVFFARFIPIIRTFAPFIAGIGKMKYSRFLTYNIIGGLIWVGLFLSAGYYFGNIPLIRKNLTLVVLIIILTSFIPPLIEYLIVKKKSQSLFSF